MSSDTYLVLVASDGSQKAFVFGDDFSAMRRIDGVWVSPIPTGPDSNLKEGLERPTKEQADSLVQTARAHVFGYLERAKGTVPLTLPAQSRLGEWDGCPVVLTKGTCFLFTFGQWVIEEDAVRRMKILPAAKWYRRYGLLPQLPKLPERFVGLLSFEPSASDLVGMWDKLPVVFIGKMPFVFEQGVWTRRQDHFSQIIILKPDVWLKMFPGLPPLPPDAFPHMASMASGSRGELVLPDRAQVGLYLGDPFIMRNDEAWVLQRQVWICDARAISLGRVWNATAWYARFKHLPPLPGDAFSQA